MSDSQLELEYIELKRKRMMKEEINDSCKV